MNFTFTLQPDMVCDEVVDELQKSKYFAVLVDESRDASKTE